MDRETKIKAAVAAVSAYLKSQEEAAAAAASIQARELRPSFNHWGAGGRQAMMNNRNMMQLKAFNR